MIGVFSFRSHHAAADGRGGGPHHLCEVARVGGESGLAVIVVADLKKFGTPKGVIR